MFEPVVVLQIGLSNSGDYHAHFSLTPSLIYCGIGNWSSNWILGEKNLGTEVLTGSGTFVGKGYLSTITFKTKLQITRKGDYVIPFPEPEPVTNIWDGNLTLVGGNVQGFLSRQTGSDYPKLYNIAGKYSDYIQQETVIIRVSDLKITY